MTNQKPQHAVILTRISDDREQEAKGVARQEADCRKLADKLGWTIAAVVVENDTSAFKRVRIRLPDGTTALRTVRPGFRSVIDGLASGEYDGLLAYDLDRVCRDIRDLEDLIDVATSRRPRIPVETCTGSLSLANDTGVDAARMMVVFKNRESRDIARRVARKHEELAAEGKWNGGGFRGYGFTTKGHKVIPEEAAILREIGDRILSGETYHAIAEDLKRRQVPSATGAPWTGRSVRSVVSKPAVAGLRVYKGKVVAEAKWDAIIERSRWEEICTRIADRATDNDLTLQRWLNGALHCSKCGHGMTGSHGNGGPRYWCATPQGGCGKIAVKASLVEDVIEQQVLELLRTPRVIERLRHAADDVNTVEVRNALAEDEAQLVEVARMWARKEIGLPAYRAMRDEIEVRVKESRALLVARAPRVLRSLLAADVEAGWRGLAAAEKREVTLALCPAGWRVMPHDRSMGNKFDPGRLVPVED